MSFIAPLWLMGLIGWLVVALWLLGRRRRAPVPFLPLWPAPETPHRPRWRPEAPPLPIVAVLGAILLSIAAAARPALSGRGKAVRAVTVIVDRGLSMSVRAPDGMPRFAKAAELAQAAFEKESTAAQVTLAAVPPANGDSEVSGGDGGWLDEIRHLPLTAVVEPAAVAGAVRQALESNHDVVVLSDQNLKIDNLHLVQLSPDSSPNIGIALFSVRDDAKAQAMARVINRSDAASARLIVRSDGQSVAKIIDLPPRGAERNYFVDLPKTGRVVEAEIKGNDPPALNHLAWNVRTSNWPSIKRPTAVPEGLDRLIDIYSRRRPAGQDSRRIVVVGSMDAAPSDLPTAIWDDAPVSGPPLPAVETLMLATKPVDTSDVDWPSILKGARVSPLPTGNWQPLVRAAGKTVVAFRTQPVKQVWVGFHSEQFARQVDFVIFWSRVFDWLGDGSRSYAAEPVGALVGDWQLQRPGDVAVSQREAGLVPGLYRRPDGMLTAVNAPALPDSVLATGNCDEKLSRLAPAMRPLRPLSGQLILASIALLNIVVMVAVRRGDYSQSSVKS